MIENNVKSNRVFLYSILTMLLIVYGLIYPILTIVAFLLQMFLIVKYEEEHTICNLLFLVPFAGVFKLSADSTSLFTYITFFFIVISFIKNRRISKEFLLPFAIYSAFCIIGCGLDVTVLLKQLSIPLLVYLGVRNKNCSVDKIVCFYSVGLLFASILGKCRNYIPQLEAYVEYERAYDVTQAVSYRFSGLYSDPNYYSVAVLLAVIGILILILTDKSNIILKVISVMLIVFGSSTISKSFFIMLAFVGVMFCIGAIYCKKYLLAGVIMTVSIVAVFLAINGEIKSVNTVMERFMNDKSITTGRSQIWGMYFEFFKENLFNLLFGVGIGCGYLNNHAAHNTLIDYIYYFGIFGFFVNIAWMKSVIKIGKKSKKEKTRLIQCYPLMVLIIMAMALSYVKFFDYEYQLLFVLLILTVDLPNRNIVPLQNLKNDSIL